MTTAITHDTAQVTTAQERLAAEARRLYDAETALHIAHQTRIDQWIAAAGDRLHEAIVAYRAALERRAQRWPTTPTRPDRNQRAGRCELAQSGRMSRPWLRIPRPVAPSAIREALRSPRAGRSASDRPNVFAGDSGRFRHRPTPRL